MCLFFFNYQGRPFVYATHAVCVVRDDADFFVFFYVLMALLLLLAYEKPFPTYILFFPYPVVTQPVRDDFHWSQAN